MKSSRYIILFVLSLGLLTSLQTRAARGEFEDSRKTKDIHEYKKNLTGTQAVQAGAVDLRKRPAPVPKRRPAIESVSIRKSKKPSRFQSRSVSTKAFSDANEALNSKSRTTARMPAQTLPLKAAGPHSTPRELAGLWISAIRKGSPENIKPLIHPKCPSHSVNQQLLERMTSGPMAPNFELEEVDIGPDERSVLRKIYAVAPEKQLNIKYAARNFDERNKYGLGKGFPISRADGKWYFVVCSKTFARAK